MSADRRCELCGREPAVDIGSSTYVCDEHAKTLRVSRCGSCGARMIAHSTVAASICSDCAASRELEALPAEVGAELERLVRARSWMASIVRVRNARPSMALHEAELVVETLRARLGVTRRAPLPELAELIAKAAASKPRPVAIEAVWDGDTHGWFVRLVAVVPAGEHGFREHDLATVADERGDMRSFDGLAPSWTEATRATEIGGAIAAHVGVPFFFGSPDAPDDEAPRWWDLRRGAE